MDAKKYLDARHIHFRDLEDVKIGRLTIRADFILAECRGVVIRPKRGSVSDRYLSLLAGDGVKYIIADTRTGVSFYGVAEDSDKLVPWRSLPATDQRHFPSKEVWSTLSDLLQALAKNRDAIRNIASNILLCRIRDEEHANLSKWEVAVSSKKEKCSDVLFDFDSKTIFLSSDSDTETLLKICAIISGFTVIPRNEDELIILLEWLGQLRDGRKSSYGLPGSLAFIFKTVRANSRNLEVATSVIGSQLLSLSGTHKSTLVLENGNPEIYPVFERLFPTTRLVMADYPSYMPIKAPDRIILVPPFGQLSVDKDKLKKFSPFFTDNTIKSKTPLEYVYLLHAIEHIAVNGVIVALVPEGILSGVSHSVFRNWLLKHIQLLGVISLPSGHCFEGTALRCSLLFMRKRDKIPNDYPITMLELRSQDLANSETLKETTTIIHQMLFQEERL